MTVYSRWCGHCSAYLEYASLDWVALKDEKETYLCKTCWTRIGQEKGWECFSLSEREREELQKVKEVFGG